MNITLTVIAILMTTVLCARAQTTATSGSSDRRISAQLDELGLQYEIDKDGDFRTVFKFTDESRTQIVYINSRTSQYDGLEIREVWSPAYESVDPLPAIVANRLLRASFDAPLGGWQSWRQPDGKYIAVFSVKLGADADGETLRKAMNAAISHADEMEKELTDGDTF